MDAQLLRPLTLFDDKKGIHGYSVGTDAIKPLVAVAKNTIHQHAMFALYSELVRHPPTWTKNGKWADITLTPEWVDTCLREAISSICISGFVAWRRVKAVLVIAVPGTFAITYRDGVWTVVTDKGPKWNLMMVDPPIRHANGKCTLNSRVFNAVTDTAIYNELYENIRKRDHFNSRPSIFTVVDKGLRNQNGSSKQWFQQQTSGVTAAARTSTVDSNFQTLVRNRATTIKELAQTSTVAREQFNSQTKLAGTTGNLEDRHTKMQHLEHMVTDGKEVQTTRALMSLSDGVQTLNQTLYNIFFHYHVPPQLLGRNINAERSGNNPRLNEMVLQSFFTDTTRLRGKFQLLLETVNVDGAILSFQPTVSPFELDVLKDRLDPACMQQLYAMAYHVPASIFMDEKAILKRKRDGEDSAGSDMQRTMQRREGKDTTAADARADYDKPQTK